MNHPSSNKEASGGTKGHLNHSGLAQEVLEEKSVSKCPRHHSFDILTKNVAAFWPCSENTLEAK